MAYSRRMRVIALAAVLFCLLLASASSGGAVRVSGSTTLYVPYGNVKSISCAAAGDCAAGGYYTDRNRRYSDGRAFVVTETNGTWGNAIRVAGDVESLSCAVAGDCAAGGATFTDGGIHASVVRETNGT